MGRFADFFREQSVPLAGQPKQKMLSLDREFEDMEAKIKLLESEKLHLQSEVGPLKRQIDHLQEQIQRIEAKSTARNQQLEEQAVKLLVAIAKRIHIGRDGGASIIDSTASQARYQLGVLGERHLVRFVGANYTTDGRYEATQKGLEYLHEKGLL